MQFFLINPKFTDYNYSVKWGDGNVSCDLNDTAAHTYGADGNYSVEINGTFPAIFLNNGLYKDMIN